MASSTCTSSSVGATARRGSACLLLAFAGACGGSAARPADGGATVSEACRIVIPPRVDSENDASSPSKDERAPSDGAPSRVIVVAEASLTDIARELEKSVGRRLADVRGAGIGMAGRVSYTADRGPFSVSVDRDALVVRTDVRAQAKVCKGRRCYASCAPEAVALARVPLLLQPDYRFGPVRVTAQITRGCKIKTLGGFLTVDVTPNIEKRLAPELRKVERRIAAQLPDVRAHAERAWRDLDRPRDLPVLGCLEPKPRGIVQGPVDGEKGRLRLHFALTAEPELRPTCPEAAAPSRLPPLERATQLPDEEELRVGLVSPLGAVATALEQGPPAEVDGARVRVDRAKVDRQGSSLAASVVATGEICGEISLSAVPRWNGDHRAIVLSSAVLLPPDAKRVSAVSIESGAFAEALTGGARVPVPIVVERVGEALDGLAKAASDEAVDVTVNVSRTRPIDATVRDDELVARVGVRGSVLLRVHPPRGHASP